SRRGSSTPRFLSTSRAAAGSAKPKTMSRLSYPIRPFAYAGERRLWRFYSLFTSTKGCRPWAGQPGQRGARLRCPTLPVVGIQARGARWSQLLPIGGHMEIRQRQTGSVVRLDLVGRLIGADEDCVLKDKVNSLLLQGYRTILL